MEVSALLELYRSVQTGAYTCDITCYRKSGPHSLRCLQYDGGGTAPPAANACSSCACPRGSTSEHCVVSSWAGTPLLSCSAAAAAGSRSSAATTAHACDALALLKSWRKATCPLPTGESSHPAPLGEGAPREGAYRARKASPPPPSPPTCSNSRDRPEGPGWYHRSVLTPEGSAALPLPR